MFTEKMSKIHFLVLRQDVNTVLEYLGRNDCIQITDRVRHDKDEAPVQAETVSYSQVLQKLNVLKAYLRYDSGAGSDRFVHEREFSLPGKDEFVRVDAVLHASEIILKDEGQLRQKKEQLEQALHEAEAFAKLNVPFSEIEHLTFLVIRFGTSDPRKLESVRQALNGRGILIPLDDSGKLLAISTKKGRWTLESELKKADFRDLAFPEQLKGIPSEIVDGLKKELADADHRLESIEHSKSEFIRTYSSELDRLIEQFRIGSIIEDARGELPSSKAVYRISGWIPSRNVEETVSELDRITGNRIAVRTFNPLEVPEIRAGKAKVPVKMRHGKFVRAFEGLVFSYGAPLYGTIDPTIFVAILFIILFSIMFGDVGQGFIGLLIGLVLKRGAVESLRKFQKFGVIFIAVGIASMFTGFLYGSVFSVEHLLIPVTRAISGSLFGKPMDRFVEVMPTEGVDQLFMFFGFTIGLGVIINSVGLIINIYNQFSLGNYYKAIFVKTGLAGTFFFWYAIGMAVRYLLGAAVFSWEIWILVLPLGMIFLGEPLFHVITGKRPIFKEGLTQFFVEGFVEILESVSYFLSNSVSFLRVGAFALSHTVLSVIVFRLTEMVSEAPGGILFGAIVLIFGNSLIIVLEGLIVSIQVVRLQYYEFFSKFFTDSGEEWKPFSFRRKEYRQ